MIRIKNFLTVVLLSFFVVSCARDFGSRSYVATEVGDVSETYAGTILSVTFVTLKEKNRLVDNKTGATVGLLGGAVLGNTIGRGKGRNVTTVLGGLAGAAAGAAIEDNLSTQQGVQYVVKLDDGRILTVVQGTDIVLNKGQRAYVTYPRSDRTRARVFPA